MSIMYIIGRIIEISMVIMILMMDVDDIYNKIKNRRK